MNRFIRFVILIVTLISCQDLCAQVEKIEGRQTDSDEVKNSIPNLVGNTYIQYVEELNVINVINVDYIAGNSSKDIEVLVYKDNELLIDDLKQDVVDGMNDTYPISEYGNGDYEVIVIEDNDITAVENITVE
ncbi:MAG: hypothetical protein J6A70_02115 [Prevotella sp.]|nr:hypothetical protein [Prevotella sp.]